MTEQTKQAINQEFGNGSTVDNVFVSYVNAYLNKVWHSTIEDPEECKDILLMYKASDGRKIYHIGLFDKSTRKVLISQRTSIPWQQITRFEKWAYMEDLLPDKNI